MIAYSNNKAHEYDDIDSDKYKELLNQDKKDIADRINTQDYEVTKIYLSHDKEGQISIAVLVKYTVTDGIEKMEFSNQIYFPINSLNNINNDELTNVCKPDEIESINVTAKSSKLYPQMYTNSGTVEYDIKENDNIADIIETCNNYVNGFGADYSNIDSGSNTRFDMVIKLKAGGEERYSICGFGTEEQNRFYKVMMSKEVVRQVGKVFSLNEKDKSKVQLFPWEKGTDEDAYVLDVTDKVDVSRFIELAKMMTISKPENTFVTNIYGIECYNSKGEIIYFFNFDKETKNICKLKKVVKNFDKIMLN